MVEQHLQARRSLLSAGIVVADSDGFASRKSAVISSDVAIMNLLLAGIVISIPRVRPKLRSDVARLIQLLRGNRSAGPHRRPYTTAALQELEPLLVRHVATLLLRSPHIIGLGPVVRVLVHPYFAAHVRGTNAVLLLLLLLLLMMLRLLLGPHLPGNIFCRAFRPLLLIERK
jgi:hypothetical protein